MTVNELSKHIEALIKQGHGNTVVISEMGGLECSSYELINCVKFIKDCQYSDWQGSKINTDVVFIGVD